MKYPNPIFGPALFAATVLVATLASGAAHAMAGDPAKMEPMSDAMPGAMNTEMPGGLEGYRFTGETETCISTTRIRSSKTLDNNNILFTLTNRKVYLNRLRHSCPGLRASGGFGYRTSGSRLCRGEMIQVLDMNRMGAACSLGLYEELEKVEMSDEGAS